MYLGREMQASFGRRGTAAIEANSEKRSSFPSGEIFQRLPQLIGAIIVGLAALFGIQKAYVAYEASSAEVRKAELQRASAALYEDMLQSHIQSVKNTVAGMLKNPDTAKFRNVTIDRKTKAVCGYVNGANSYGGYGGESRFVSTDDMVYLVKQPDDGANPAGSAAIYNNCD